MSIYAGGYMMNEVLHGLVKVGVLKGMSADQKKFIRKLLWRVCVDNDCNWGEIIDLELAILLDTCPCCGTECKEINVDDECCASCR